MLAKIVGQVGFMISDVNDRNGKPSRVYTLTEQGVTQLLNYSNLQINNNNPPPSPVPSVKTPDPMLAKTSVQLSNKDVNKKQNSASENNEPPLSPRSRV